MKNQLEYMKREKEKKNIANMSTEIQNISYHEELEYHRSRLEKMLEDNLKYTETEDGQEETVSILGRFKKRKN